MNGLKFVSVEHLPAALKVANFHHQFLVEEFLSFSTKLDRATLMSKWIIFIIYFV